MARLPESEARKLAIIFEEVAAYEYREQRKSRNATSAEQSGIQPGFEEDFSFGEDDSSDYGDRPDVKELWPFE